MIRLGTKLAEKVIKSQKIPKETSLFFANNFIASASRASMAIRLKSVLGGSSRDCDKGKS